MSLPASKFAVLPGGAPAASPRPHKTNLVEARRALDRELELKEVIDCVCELFARLEGRIESYKAAIAELTRRKKCAEARLERLEDEVITRMEAARLQLAPGFRHSLETRPAPPAVDVLDESVIPACYLREKVTVSVDKVAIKSALARGQAIAGVRLTQKISLLRK